MAKQYIKLITLIIILLAIPYPTWYATNYYTAGLIDQTQLIEYGMEDDFIYCNDWRPRLFDQDKRITGYKVITQLYRNTELNLAIQDFNIKRLKGLPQDMGAENVSRLPALDLPPIKSTDWATKYKYHKIITRIIKNR